MQDRKILFEKQAEIAKALGHPLRVAVLEFLREDEKCVCDIVEFVGSQQSNVSKHLSLMVGAGILQSRKEGLKVFYKIKTVCVLEFLDCMTQCIKSEIEEQNKLLKSL